MTTTESAYWQPIGTGNAVHSSCLNCPPKPGVLRYRDDPTPGFGMVGIFRDGETVAGTCGEAATLIRRWRGEAHRDPDHEWVIEIDGPMSGVRYTRQPTGKWLTTHRSRGFA